MKSPTLHFIIVIVAGIGVLAGYYFWYSVVASESVSAANLQHQINSETEAPNNATLARTASVEIKNDETIVQKYFFPENGVVAFINNLEERTKTLGAAVTVTSVSAGTGERSVLVMALHVEGTFDSVMRTVGNIEYAPYDIVVSKLSLKQDGDNSWHADLGLAVGTIGSATAKNTP